MSDHELCDDAITTALANGQPGKAEFLATRCDLYHGRYRTTHAAPSRAALTPDLGTTDAPMVAHEED